MAKEGVVHTHVFCFNPEDNGGEAVCLKTRFHENGDNNENSIWLEQELSLQSYAHSAGISAGVFTPKMLRKLANELDEAMIQARANR
jgi:hypothetical protein